MITLFFFLSMVMDKKALVEKLRDDNFFVREEAQKRITEKIDFKFYKKLLAILDNEKEDPEVISRVKNIVKKYELSLVSQYKVDLMGYGCYPFIDEGLPDSYAWKGFRKYAIVDYYVKYAEATGVKRGAHYDTYRKATELWMQDRLYDFLKESVKNARDEKELCAAMNSNMKVIQDDILMLIKGDDKYWIRIGGANPFKMEKTGK